MDRVSKDIYYLGIAEDISARSTCLRRKYGAVIVKNDEIISTGYNGAPRGFANCNNIGHCNREQLGIKHGERYELCRAVHAEQNAIISAARRDMIGSTMYLVGTWPDGERCDTEPCALCKKMICNAGIEKVVTYDGIFETKRWDL